MKDARISELRDGLSRFLALVRKGEVVRILDRDVPIAQIVPIQAAFSRPLGEEALADLERKGLIRRGRRAIPDDVLKKDPPGRPVGALDALLQERRRS